MTLSERYTANAAECMLLAKSTRDQQRRAMLLNMSECWSALAVRALHVEEGGRLDTAT
jgi:hypothetical protein